MLKNKVTAWIPTHHTSSPSQAAYARGLTFHVLGLMNSYQEFHVHSNLIWWQWHFYHVYIQFYLQTVSSIVHLGGLDRAEMCKNPTHIMEAQPEILGGSEAHPWSATEFVHQIVQLQPFTHLLVSNKQHWGEGHGEGCLFFCFFFLLVLSTVTTRWEYISHVSCGDTLQPSAPWYPQHHKSRPLCFTTAPGSRRYEEKGRGAEAFCSLKFEQLDSARVLRVFPGKEVSGLCRQIAWEQTSGVPQEAPPPQLCAGWSALALIRLRLSQGKRAINSCMIVTCFALPKSGFSCLQLPELHLPLQLQKGYVSHVSAHGCASPGHEVQFLLVLCPSRLLTLAFAESLLPGTV